MATIDEIFAGRFLDAAWAEDSKTLMGDFREAIRGAADSGRTTKVSFTVEFSSDEKTGEIVPKLSYGGSIAKRQRTAQGFTLRDSGQLDIFTAEEAADRADKPGDPPPPGLGRMIKKQREINEQDELEAAQAELDGDKPKMALAK